MPSPRREFPYFKVQIFDERSVTWREKKVGFDTIKEARDYVKSLTAERQVRIVLADEDGYREVDHES